MDSSLSWVLHGQADSIAFVAADCDFEGRGFDVYAGNLRGLFPRKSTEAKEASYWDYSIDDFAKYDITAFLERIIEIKVNELREYHREQNPHLKTTEEVEDDIRKRLKIKYVGHSMGAMILPMYLVIRKL
mmetsp:Transcript_28220/g.42711  ORF Transcript_28220/g.42711 Transcript_28220/m.42711 type:complete len:130 (+) Transcript_28220:430-819(+)